jgi:hypothetical protein
VPWKDYHITERLERTSCGEMGDSPRLGSFSEVLLTFEVFGGRPLIGVLGALRDLPSWFTGW